jgi:acetate---CoA ligase (ADP-forming)
VRDVNEVPGPTTVRDILQQRRVLLVGATTGATAPQTFNAAITRSLGHAELDEVVFVGRSGGHFGNIPILESLSDVGASPPEVAVVAVPRRELLATVERCAGIGVKAAIVITGSLTDSDRDGLRGVCRSGMRIWGPNCIGFLSTLHGLTAFATDWRPVTAKRPYAWSIIVQSGGAALSLAVLAARTPVAVRQLFTTGDEIDIGSEEILEYLAGETRIDGCILFLEEPRQPDRFRRALAALRIAGKPVVIVKVGRTAGASEMAFSHSGVTVGGWAEFTAAAEASGAVVCDSYADAMASATVLAASRRRRAPRRVAIVSSSGGTAALACDLMTGKRLELATLSAQAQDQLATACGGAVGSVNPFDAINAGGIRPGAPAYLEAIRGDSGIDVAALVHVGSRGAAEVGFALEASALEGEHLVVATWPSVPQPVETRLLEQGIPVFDDIDVMLRGLSSAVGWHESGDVSESSFDSVLANRAQAVPRPYIDGIELVTSAGLPVPRSLTASSLAELRDAWTASGLRFPVVVKGATVRGHKRAQGAVRTGVRELSELDACAAGMLSSFGRIIVEQQIDGEAEVMVAARETKYGQVLCTGLGGVYADYALQAGEVLYVAEPFSAAGLQKRLAESRLGGIMHAVGPEGVIGSVARISVSIAALLRKHGLQEIEINPLVLTAAGPVIVDVKIS